MDFYLRVILLLLAIVVSAVMLYQYGFVRNTIDPINDMMPTVIDEHSGNTVLSKELWMVDRALLPAEIVSLQYKNDVLLQWNLNCGMPVSSAATVNKEFPYDISLRLQVFYTVEPEWNSTTLDPIGVVLAGWGDLSREQRMGVILRGGYILLHPLRDATTDASPRIDQINNTLVNRRINVLNVRGMAGSYTNVVLEFLERHPNARNFVIEQFTYDDGEVFFVIRPADNNGPEC